jgi:hypothetical protein
MQNRRRFARHLERYFFIAPRNNFCISTKLRDASNGFSTQDLGGFTTTMVNNYDDIGFYSVEGLYLDLWLQ